LKRPEDRIQNAKNTIFIREEDIDYNTVLLIDDFVGSGATLNETAIKLKTA
jgi:phosphoribosyl transferase domain